MRNQSVFIFLISSFQICFGRCESCEDLNILLFANDRNFEFIDLSHTYSTEFRNGSSEICTATELSYENFNYPLPKSQRVSNIPLNKLILPLIIADISGLVKGHTKFQLQIHHLDYFLNNYFGRTYQPCLIVFKFGWSKYYRDQRKYFGLNNDSGGFIFPGISEEVAKWITSSYKNVVGVGVDLPSVDPGFSEESLALKAFTDAGVYVLKNVKLDQFLPEASCTAVVLPVKSEVICSPFRLIAVCPKSKMEQRKILLHHL